MFSTSHLVGVTSGYFVMHNSCPGDAAKAYNGKEDYYLMSYTSHAHILA